MQSNNRYEAPVGVRLLFPVREAREHVDNLLTDELLEAASRVALGPVTHTIDFAAFRAELARFEFASPQPLEKLLRWTIKQLEHGLVHVTHPRYFGLFNPSPTFAAQCADRIAGGFNPQLATWTTSPVAVEIENYIIREIARRTGLTAQAAGHFTSGGSEANYTALICALTNAHPEFAVKGSRAFEGPPIFYVSKESHLAWLKIAHQAGIGRSGVHLIATDGCGRMDSDALASALNTDRAHGCIPIMIAATAGTTNAGMIDPLEACAKLARSANLWYHIDAAWGGALIASDRYRHILRGIEQADSITIDAHKWFATTMGCGMFLTSHPLTLSSAFQVSTNFMPSNLLQLDPYITSVQWSRRFLGLRLFLSLGAAGWPGYAEHIERAIRLSAVLQSKLEASGWSIVNDSPVAVLCIRPPFGCADVRSIVNRVLASGRGWVAATVFESKDVIRTCITNGETSESDLDELVAILQDAATTGTRRQGSF